MDEFAKKKLTNDIESQIKTEQIVKDFNEKLGTEGKLPGLTEKEEKEAKAHQNETAQNLAEAPLCGTCSTMFNENSNWETTVPGGRVSRSHKAYPDP